MNRFSIVIIYHIGSCLGLGHIELGETPLITIFVLLLLLLLQTHRRCTLSLIQSRERERENEATSEYLLATCSSLLTSF
jgi:hypothetical protein